VTPTMSAARGSFQLVGYLSFRRLCPIVFKKVSTKSGGAVAPGRCSLFPPSTLADALAGLSNGPPAHSRLFVSEGDASSPGPVLPAFTISPQSPWSMRPWPNSRLGGSGLLTPEHLANEVEAFAARYGDRSATVLTVVNSNIVEVDSCPDALPGF
jgi:hypothetical protein